MTDEENDIPEAADYEHETVPTPRRRRHKQLSRIARFFVGTGLTVVALLANRNPINSQAYDQLPPDAQIALKWGAEEMKRFDPENRFKQVNEKELMWVLATDPELVERIIAEHQAVMRIQEIEKTYGIRTGFADTDISAEPALYNEVNSPIR